MLKRVVKKPVGWEYHLHNIVATMAAARDHALTRWNEVVQLGTKKRGVWRPKTKIFED